MKSKIIFTLFFLISFIWFFPSLFVFFVQDDFWLLAITKVESIAEFVHFFRPLETAVWYRPLSSQVFFWVARSLFGLQPFHFHVLVIITHALTASMLYRLVGELQKGQRIATISGIIYLLHQLHTVSVSWPAAYSFVLTPLLITTTLYFHFHKKYWLAFGIFVLALLSSETAVVLPVALFACSLFTSRKINRNSLMYWFPVVVFVIIRWILFPTANESDLYAMQMTNEVVATMKFYFLRLIGIPLGFPALETSAKILITLASILSSFFLIWSIVIQMSNVGSQKKINPIFFWLLCAGIAPFLLLPNHLAPYYASIALLGYAPLVANGILLLTNKTKKYRHYILLVLLVIFSVQHYFGHHWQYRTHWIFTRAKLARQLVSEFKLDHEVGTEEYFALGANKAKEVYINNK